MIATLVLWAALAAAPTSPPADICYDRAAIVRIDEARNFVDLNDLLPQQLWLGGRWDLTLTVDQTLAGARLPAHIRARVILTDMYQHHKPLLMLLRHGASGSASPNTVHSWGDRMIPAATAAYPWQVILVGSAGEPFNADDPDLPPRFR